MSESLHEIMGREIRARHQRGFFTYPFFGNQGGGGWVTEEWVVATCNYSGTDNRRVYGKTTASSWSLLKNDAQPETANAVASDGKFVWEGNSGGAIRQYRWSGSAFVQVLDALYGGSGGNSVSGLFTFRDGGNHLVCLGQEGFGWGEALISHQVAPTYIYTYHTRYNYAGGNVHRKAMGARVADPDTQAELDTLVTAGDASQTIRAYTRSGNTLVEHGSVAISANMNAYYCRMDPNTGLIVGTDVTPTTNMSMYQLNMSTRALSSIGTSSTITPTVRACAAIKNLIVVLGTNRTLYTYSRSGTTLTQLDTYASAIPGDSAKNKVWCSPYTGWIYVTGDQNNNGKVFEIDDSGNISLLISTLPIRSFASGDIVDMTFLPAALTASAS